MMFGSYSINEKIKTRTTRLGLHFKTGDIYFYASSIQLIEDDIDVVYDWAADVMNDSWNVQKAKKKLKGQPETLVCDALLDQHIFSGVGNIIKNEVCYRIKVHPESTIGWLPAKQLNDLVKEARNYSLDFLEWKKQFVLKKHWLVYTKKKCKRCNMPVVKKYSGKTKRRTFFCTNCQVMYCP